MHILTNFFKNIYIFCQKYFVIFKRRIRQAEELAEQMSWAEQKLAELNALLIFSSSAHLIRSLTIFETQPNNLSNVTLVKFSIRLVLSEKH